MLKMLNKWGFLYQQGVPREL